MDMVYVKHGAVALGPTAVLTSECVPAQYSEPQLRWDRIPRPISRHRRHRLGRPPLIAEPAEQTRPLEPDTLAFEDAAADARVNDLDGLLVRPSQSALNQRWLSPPRTNGIADGPPLVKRDAQGTWDQGQPGFGRAIRLGPTTALRALELFGRAIQPQTIYIRRTLRL